MKYEDSLHWRVLYLWSEAAIATALINGNQTIWQKFEFGTAIIHCNQHSIPFLPLFFITFRCYIFNLYRFFPVNRVSIIEASFSPSISWHGTIAFIHFTCTLCQRQRYNNNDEIKVWWNKFHWKLTLRVNLKFIICVAIQCCHSRAIKMCSRKNRTRFLKSEVDPHSYNMMCAPECGWL